MTDDLIKRLRARDNKDLAHDELGEEAADEIERLRGLLKEVHAKLDRIEVTLEMMRSLVREGEK